MPASSTSVSRSQSLPRARRPLWRRRRFQWGAVALVGLAGTILLVLHFAEFEWREFLEQVPAWLERVNTPLALVLMATLPVVGFPVSAVYLAVGALFGPAWGGLVVMGLTLCHLAATHVLARTLLKTRIEQWRGKWQRKLPVISQGDNISLVAMIIIVPGLPYVARNCLLAVSGVPLRYLLGVGVPLYVARSYTTLFVGNLGSNHSAGTFGIIGAIFVAKLAVSALLFLRLRRADHS
jgi:uncharacterized membrane protein YdjX (TVP38/TMEM64 family)